MCPALVELISSRIRLVGSLPVVRGYYLVLGGGKIGDSFLRYLKKARFPFVLVIDADANAPASLNSDVVSDMGHIVGIIKSMAITQGNDKLKKSSQNEENDAGKAGVMGGFAEPRFYFHRMDVNDVFSLLTHGLPEFVIPAVPSHAAADIVACAMDFGQGRLVSKLSISGNDGEIEKRTYFENIVTTFPKDIVAGNYPEHGAIFFSYAQPGEICPDNCPGQESYCRTFARKKPRTITSYVRDLTSSYPGQVFESYQMKPGIGGIRGSDLRRNLVSIMRHVRAIRQSPQEHGGIKESSFFIATTCNCHGILTLMQVK
ncbi:hypothetical protein [Methanolobus sp.]|uniref:hypothetical protein n=1 Tax=Methanolobus sp. TaxID=1874737 RepID=UPI0025CC889F|nr:hypothetical protein [Methanolobus sp.]